ncbi:MAG: long-chain fatty acid--CoA ligase [Desulfuromonas sp.]|nr:MAG: long-chain fatty acid--CoA ligase [Desulfuromonas sp.]
MNNSIPAMVLENTERFQNRTAMREKVDGCYTDIRWTELRDNILLHASCLLALDIKPDERVAIMAPNSPEWAYADLATMAIGGVSVPVYHTEGIDTLVYILKDSESHALFIHSQLIANELLEQLEHLPELRHIILLSGTLEHPQVIALEDFLRLSPATRDGRIQTLLGEISQDRLASIVYTSGTTGDPKGVMLSHGNLLSNIEGCARLFDIGPTDTCLSFLPLSHVFERVDGYYFMLYKGAVIAYAESIDTVPADLEAVKPTIVISVPRLFEKMFARIMERVTSSPWIRRKIFFAAIAIGRHHATNQIKGDRDGPLLKIQMDVADHLVFSQLREKLGGQLRFFVSGGAPLPANVNDFFLAAGLQIFEGYGLTETAAGIAANHAGAFRPGSVGRPIEGTELKIAPDGEIMIRGAGVFKGYWNKPDESAEVLAGDGWFHSGDIGELDNDGYLTITDRKKDIIVTSGGENVAPQNLENSFKSDKFIANAMVYGDRKPFLTALLVPNFDNLERYARMKKLSYLNHCDLIRQPRVLDLFRRRIDELQQEMPSHHKVKRFTLISRDFTSEEGEITPTMKIRRKNIAQNFRHVLEGMYLAPGKGVHDSAFCVIDNNTDR